MTDLSTDLASDLARWPGLAGLPRLLPPVRWERGVLGKEPGGQADFHWIAASGRFSGPGSDLARRLGLGSEDVVRDCLLWRGESSLHQAVRCYPARVPDARGRPFLEKQVLEWERPARLPAALGALTLLPLAAGVDDGVWRERPRDPFAARLLVRLPAADCPPAIRDPAALARTIRAGIAELADRFTAPSLGTLYARLLAGHRGVFPPEALDPLGAAALAVLLLPLPRAIADRLCLAGWLPSTQPAGESLRRHWDLILGSDGPAPPPDPGEAPPTPAQQARGLVLARALLGGEPRGLGAEPGRTAERGRAPAADGGRPEPAPEPILVPAPVPIAAPAAPAVGATRISLWGPSGSGKTLFLGQLYWELSALGEGDWVVYPGARGLDFLELLRDTLYSRNAFPPGTSLGTALDIECHLVHRQTGERVTLELEDRAGADYERLHPEVQERLLGAHGVLLLLDPERRDDQVFSEVSHTCERLLLAAGRAGTQDPRPVALCLTKADTLIATPQDYRAALAAPADFAAAHLDPRLLDYLRSRFAHLALFPVSAAGVRLRFGAIEPVVFWDETLRPRINRGRPFNLLAPLDWLLRQVGGLSTDRPVGPLLIQPKLGN